MKWRSICSVVSKSAITPCRSGRVAGCAPVCGRSSAAPERRRRGPRRSVRRSRRPTARTRRSLRRAGRPPYSRCPVDSQLPRRAWTPEPHPHDLFALPDPAAGAERPRPTHPAGRHGFTRARVSASNALTSSLVLRRSRPLHGRQRRHRRDRDHHRPTAPSGLAEDRREAIQDARGSVHSPRPSASPAACRARLPAGPAWKSTVSERSGLRWRHA